jgi:hypothetical protein
MEPGSIVEGLDVGEDIKLGLGTGQLRWWLSRIRCTARMGKSVRPKRRIGKTAKRGRPATGRDPSVTIRARRCFRCDAKEDRGHSVTRRGPAPVASCFSARGVNYLTKAGTRRAYSHGAAWLRGADVVVREERAGEIFVRTEV